MDAFDSLHLCAYYRNDLCIAIELSETQNVSMGGHRLGNETFANMCLILMDFVQPEIQTPTSFQSASFASLLRIDSVDQAEVVGGISSVIVFDPSYFNVVS
jgi:hypothetical protein